VSNNGVFPSFFFSFCALALALPLPFDATGLMSVLSSPPPPSYVFTVSTSFCCG
jgi:hypothetical protein